MHERTEEIQARLAHEHDEADTLEQQAREVIARSHDLVAHSQRLHERLRNLITDGEPPTHR